MSKQVGSGTARSVATSLLFLLAISSPLCTAQSNRRWHHRPAPKQPTQVTDFRYSSAKIDGITRLFNDSLIVISNGHYWLLERDEMPRSYNVKGSIKRLYPGFDQVDAIWTDPYNDISPQIYLASSRPFRVVCKEFEDEEFASGSSFCHLPVDASWKAALKDLDLEKPIDAVTWRNRTKDREGGFWVFFQGNNMACIDPYEMRLRYTYKLDRWMGIQDPITAAFYDYRNHVYHFFFDQNGYRTWKVNVTFMNSLPMSWDRAFLHGTLSPLMKINRDFFGFNEREIRNWPQPNFEKVAPIGEINGNHVDSPSGEPARSPVVPTTRRPSTAASSTRRWTTTVDSISDVLYLTSKSSSNLHSNRHPSEKLQVDDSEEAQRGVNSLEQDESDSISYQKQLMQLDQEGVLDFVPNSDVHLNVAGPRHTSSLAVLCLSLLYMIFLQARSFSA